ncbi:MAG: mobile mystery protein B [bacterium]|nr:mobile mystery protein B [bacterium]
MKLIYPPGATPIDDISGIIPKHITTQGDLDEAEFANVNKAYQKYFLGGLSDRKAPFTFEWILVVHREMFGEVWDWAGQIRKTQPNVGIAPAQIQVSLHQLLGNLKTWEESQMDPIEISARLHHELVRIHPFKNGNGRWARLITNIYQRKLKRALFQWPEKALKEEGDFRKYYIDALKKADRGDFKSFIQIHREHQES